MKHNHSATIALSILALLGWGLFSYQYIKSKSKDNYVGIPYYKEAPNFTLTNHNGEKVFLYQFRGKVTLIVWGYTHCPDICPLTLSMLRDVMKELGELSDKVQVLYITVDPVRDTPERLKGYVPHFYERFIGLTGTPKEIEKVAKDYNVFFINHGDSYGRSESDTWATYLMTHTTTIYLVDPRGKLLITYPYDKFDSKGMAKDIRKVLNQQEERN
ncbi:MAG: SCO family protein [Candidatus Dadabacteria bacterium]|nr:SCO family protein [Candidatus Dadabacteria bacterium]